MISIVVAMGLNGVIGRRGGGMPWGRGLKDDLAMFRSLTTHETIVMGRRTFTDDTKRPLPDRRNIILTRDPTFKAPGCEVVHNWNSVVAIAETSVVFVIGGAEIYNLAHPQAKRLYVTIVEEHFEGDIFYPNFESTSVWKGFKLIGATAYDANDRNTYAFTHTVWERGHEWPNKTVQDTSTQATRVLKSTNKYSQR
jgi:dihydrofolate reductase